MDASDGPEEGEVGVVERPLFVGELSNNNNKRQQIATKGGIRYPDE